MRVWNKLAFSALMLVAGNSAANNASAQSAAAQSSPTKVAVIDVGYIVKNHPAIKSQQTMMRNQVKTIQEELIKRRDALVKDSEKLKDMKEGSPDFNQMQERLAREEAQLKLDTVRKEKEIDEIGAKMAVDFYHKLQNIISRFAEVNQIEIVLQCSREQPDPKQPASIQMALEKNVVFFQDRVDLTELVLKQIQAEDPGVPTAQGVTPPQSASRTVGSRTVK